MASDAPEYVLATYLQIAERFGLSTKTAAKNKVKRAAWGHDPPNYPGETLRIRVPRSEWDRGPTGRPDRRKDLGVSREDRQASDIEDNASRLGVNVDGHGINLSDAREPSLNEVDIRSPITTHIRQPDTLDQPRVLPGHQDRGILGVREIELLLTPLKEQLHRERERGDAADARVRELDARAIRLTEQLLETREGRGAALAKAEAAEARVDDLMAQIHQLTRDKAEVQAEVDLLKEERDAKEAEFGRKRRFWLFGWRG